MRVISFGEETSPYIASYDEFFDVPAMLKYLNTEHCYCEVFDEELIDLACYNAYFPMSDMIAIDKWALVLKLHQERCIIDFENFKASKRIKKIKDRYTLTFNKDFNQCVDKINASYEYSWLSKPLVASFNKMRENQKKYTTQFCSFELWDESGNLVAGDLGFIVGSCYTSLSGFHTVSNTGHLQLYLTNMFLQENGFDFWDMGMELQYKLQMGGEVLTEQEFLERYKFTRDCNLDIKSLESIELKSE